MKQKEIEDGNLLIALYMGAGVMSSTTNSNGIQTITSIAFKNKTGQYLESIRYYESQLKYHLSWEVLMPVVERIEALGASYTIDIKLNFCFIIESNTEENVIVKSILQRTKIEAVYDCVIKFIKLYNAKKV